VLAGYVSASFYKSFKGVAWKQNTYIYITPATLALLDSLSNLSAVHLAVILSCNCRLLTAFLFPGVCFAVFFVLNFFIWGKGSSGAVSFGTMFSLLFLWFGISVSNTVTDPCSCSWYLK